MSIRPLIYMLSLWSLIFIVGAWVVSLYSTFVQVSGVALGASGLTLLFSLSLLLARKSLLTGNSANLFTFLLLKPLLVLFLLYLCSLLGNQFLLNVVIGILVLVPASISYALWIAARNTQQNKKTVRRRR